MKIVLVSAGSPSLRGIVLNVSVVSVTAVLGMKGAGGKSLREKVSVLMRKRGGRPSGRGAPHGLVEDGLRVGQLVVVLVCLNCDPISLEDFFERQKCTHGVRVWVREHTRDLLIELGLDVRVEREEGVGKGERVAGRLVAWKKQAQKLSNETTPTATHPRAGTQKYSPAAPDPQGPALRCRSPRSKHAQAMQKGRPNPAHHARFLRDALG